VKQSTMKSFLEATFNTAVGFVVSALVWSWVVPLFYPELAPYSGWDVAFGITAIFTILSIVRNYIIRRVFNRGN
jgi:hypothetical protein